MKVKPIPEEFLRTDRIRHISQVERDLISTSLKDIACPYCGNNSLRDLNYDDEYVVGCDCCDWVCPVELISDCGEAVSLFKEYYAAWTLMGKPRAFINQDCSQFFNPKKNELLKALSVADVIQSGGYISKKKLIDIFEERMQDNNIMCPVIKVTDVLDILESVPVTQSPESITYCIDCDNCVRVMDLDGGHWECIAHFDNHGNPYIPDIMGFCSECRPRRIE